ncbi:MAG: hypothetical protein HY327_01570 [Chloroflexi bacterium]|nr:hypothetical protein [Chloroflexota bacterium]
MSKRLRAACAIVSLFLLLAFVNLSPAPVLEIRTLDGARVVCFFVQPGEEIALLSINSIYGAPVAERVRILDSGEFLTTQVLSSPAVMEYYRLDDYVMLADGQAIGVPRAARYREIRMIVDARGQTRLIARGQELALWKMVADETRVIFLVENKTRFAGCRQLDSHRAVLSVGEGSEKRGGSPAVEPPHKGKIHVLNRTGGRPRKRTHRYARKSRSDH